MKTFHLIFFCVVVASETVDYTGHMVFRVTPTNDEQLEFLVELQDTDTDFWRLPGSLNRPVEFRVSPGAFDDVTATLGWLNLPYEITIVDVGKMIEEERREISLRRILASGKLFDLSNYHPLNEINEFVDRLVGENPLLVSKETIASTFEGRDVLAVTIGSLSDPNKPIIFFDCGIHAREWISPATCLWIMNELVTKYDTDPIITNYVDTFDWKFIPVLNPDGYTYTWTTDRLWRKNRFPNNKSCYGVDLNRNFQAGFGGPGSSGAVCSDTYRGRAAFSEAETEGVRHLVARFAGRIKAAISLHSYSQLWLSPYAYNKSLSRDNEEQKRVGALAIKALSQTFGTRYQSGPAAQILYVASGVATDYYYDIQKVVYSYTIELRDTGKFGFKLPRDQILPTAVETWNALKVVTDEIACSL